MSAVRKLHYKIKKLFLIKQRNREFNEFKEIKEYGVIIKLPKFSKFPKNLLPL